MQCHNPRFYVYTTECVAAICSCKFHSKCWHEETQLLSRDLIISLEEQQYPIILNNFASDYFIKLIS